MDGIDVGIKRMCAGRVENIVQRESHFGIAKPEKKRFWRLRKSEAACEGLNAFMG